MLPATSKAKTKKPAGLGTLRAWEYEGELLYRGLPTSLLALPGCSVVTINRDSRATASAGSAIDGCILAPGNENAEALHLEKRGITMFGTVAEAFGENGFGTISSKTAGGKVRFSKSSLMPDNAPDVGDHVDFELGTLDGVPQAISVKLVAKVSGVTPIPLTAALPNVRPPVTSKRFASVLTDLHRGHESACPPPKAPPPQFDQAPKPQRHRREHRDHPGKVECGRCGKLMVPRLNVFRGKPERSFCPFCGAVHRDFRPSVWSSAGKFLMAVVFFLAVIIPMFF